MGLTPHIIPWSHLHHLRAISILLVGYGSPVVGSPSAKVWAPGLKRPEIWTSSGGSGAGNWPFWQCEVCDQNGTKHGNGGIASKCLLFFSGLNHVLISNNLIWNVKPSFFPARWFHGFVHPFLEMIHTWTKYLLDGLNIARPNKCYW